MTGVKRRASTDSDICALPKELDEVCCPICMDHPHNAVLLLCSSHEKGCKSYICDTSYRHSNCLDRFKKLRVTSSSPTLSRELPRIPDQSNGAFSTITLDPQGDGNSRPSIDHNVSVFEVLTEGLGSRPEGHGADRRESSLGDNRVEDAGLIEILSTDSLHGRVHEEGGVADETPESKLSLKCPLCRGDVLGWVVNQDARSYLNLKKRGCSRESCSYHGNYQELRQHARRVHPTARPSHVDPSREHAWRRLEHQREYADIVSTIRSAIPGALVIGDYVIDNGDRFTRSRANGAGAVGQGHWWTTFFLFHMVGAIDTNGDPRPRSRSWVRHRRTSGTERRVLWGENLLGLLDGNDPEDEDDCDGVQILSDGEDATSNPRRRRRLTRSRSNEDRQ
ncbi:hypothetical protein MLD38_031713 [Melastoma candidum]|uniref:Uncharacterized protein n=1 Tax=Melastoma candidum TaxID=119954 RepID=A0ACB9MQC6_9MYRT|nr:hypothetical protein MLD38_031713 [Melastoma candidum]